jgi:hypothetical protein
VISALYFARFPTSPVVEIRREFVLRTSEATRNLPFFYITGSLSVLATLGALCGLKTTKQNETTDPGSVGKTR